ncbi:hypothetical protein NL676_002301 [Syzygium grande]|nr:hypothetical protein NL676_002301 [Syzygium grande]
MAGFVRAKRGSDLLDDRARARLVGADLRRLSSDTSGSEHDGEDDSPCLSELVNGFLEVEPDDDPAASRPPADCGSDSDGADSPAGWADAIEGVLEEALAGNADSYRSLLLRHVSRAIEVFACLWSNKPALRRNVMSYLREIGYNAAICKTKWDASGGLTAGNYEFIDVVRSEPSEGSSQNRYFVDVDFDGHFAIARPAPEYTLLLQRVPRAFVGGIEDLKRVVRAMCDAARRSLKSRGLSAPVEEEPLHAEQVAGAVPSDDEPVAGGRLRSGGGGGGDLRWRRREVPIGRVRPIHERPSVCTHEMNE